MTNFYVLKRLIEGARDADTEILQPLGPIRTGEAPRCPNCGGFIGMLPLLPPIVGDLELYGRFFGDVAYGGSTLFFSDRFVDEFRARRLVGLNEFIPVKILKKKLHSRRTMNQLPRYYLADPVRSRAVIDDARSGAVRSRKSICPECLGGNGPKQIDRLVLADGSWSGEDIFIARGCPGVEIISEAFRNMCLEMRFLNFHFIGAADFRYSYP